MGKGMTSSSNYNKKYYANITEEQREIKRKNARKWRLRKKEGMNGKAKN